MISFAQNAEDVVLGRFFKDQEPQVYVDIGAGHPTYHSVTKHFYEVGWRGLNIEPRRKCFEALELERARDTNVNCAVSNGNGSIDFYEINEPGYADGDSGGLSTVDPQAAAEYRGRDYQVERHTVAVHTLSELLERHGIDEIGFLKVDVEGHEAEVMRSLDWQRWRPRVIVVESTVPGTSDLRDEEVFAYLSERDYIPALFDGINRFYVRREDQELLPRIAVPANVLDQYLTYEHWRQWQARLEADRKCEAANLQVAERIHEVNMVTLGYEEVRGRLETLWASNEETLRVNNQLDELLRATQEQLHGTRASLAAVEERLASLGDEFRSLRGSVVALESELDAAKRRAAERSLAGRFRQGRSVVRSYLRLEQKTADRPASGQDRQRAA